jgi:hypothetical protein
MILCRTIEEMEISEYGNLTLKQQINLTTMVTKGTISQV